MIHTLDNLTYSSVVTIENNCINVTWPRGQISRNIECLFNVTVLGPEIGDEAGKSTGIVRALYGLKSAGASFRVAIIEAILTVSLHTMLAYVIEASAVVMWSHATNHAFCLKSFTLMSNSMWHQTSWWPMSPDFPFGETSSDTLSISISVDIASAHNVLHFWHPWHKHAPQSYRVLCKLVVFFKYLSATSKYLQLFCFFS